MTADASLMFSSASESAIDQVVNPSAFPAGCLFVSDVETNAYSVFIRGAVPGALVSFARTPGKAAMPRASRHVVGGPACVRRRTAALARVSRATPRLRLRVQLLGRPVPRHERHGPEPYLFLLPPHAVLLGPGAGSARLRALSCNLLYAAAMGGRCARGTT